MIDQPRSLGLTEIWLDLGWGWGKWENEVQYSVECELKTSRISCTLESEEKKKMPDW